MKVKMRSFKKSLWISISIFIYYNANCQSITNVVNFRIDSIRLIEFQDNRIVENSSRMIPDMGVLSINFKDMSVKMFGVLSKEVSFPVADIKKDTSINDAYKITLLDSLGNDCTLTWSEKTAVFNYGRDMYLLKIHLIRPDNSYTTR